MRIPISAEVHMAPIPDFQAAPQNFPKIPAPATSIFEIGSWILPPSDQVVRENRQTVSRFLGIQFIINYPLIDHVRTMFQDV